MPFDRPTLSELRAQVAADINAGLPGVDSLLRYSNLGILGDGSAGMINGLYGYLDWIARNAVPFTAQDEHLEGWAALKGVIRKPATAASGTAIFTGTSGTIPLGAILVRSDGAQFKTTLAGTISAGSVTVPVTAVIAGADGNTASAAILSLSSGIAGINGQGAVATAIGGGADVETDDEFRTRMIQAYANPAQGGSAADYVTWALAVPGVTRCWVNPAGNPGTVTLLFMMDDTRAAYGGFPQGTNGTASAETRASHATGDQLILANALFAVQPVTALVSVLAPVANTIGLTIAGISTASTATKAAIAAAFTTALKASAVPGGVTPVSAIEAAIASVSGAAGFVITSISASAGSVAPGSAGNITSNAGALPVPGAINYA